MNSNNCWISSKSWEKPMNFKDALDYQKNSLVNQNPICKPDVKSSSNVLEDKDIIISELELLNKKLSNHINGLYDHINNL